MPDKHVVIIDDSKINCDIMIKICQHNKIPNAMANTGDDGITLIHKMLDDNDQIGCIILDIMMPKMSGIEVLKKLKDSEKTRDLPVIMCSALNEKEKVLEARQYGAAGYILKPFKKEDFLEKIKPFI